MNFIKIRTLLVVFSFFSVVFVNRVEFLFGIFDDDYIGIHFVSEQVAVNEQVVNFDAETVIDFQTSYQFTDSFGMLLQVNNLTDEPTQSYFGTTSKTGTTQFFGRQFYLGFTYNH